MGPSNLASLTSVGIPQGKDGKDVLLISMPMASLSHPTIGLALLKNALLRNGRRAVVRHFFIEFAEYVGVKVYEDINDDRYFLALVGEWLFAPAAHESHRADDISYVSRVLYGEYRDIIDASKVLKILEARKLVPGFLDLCMESVDWDAYAIVGFSNSFQQSMASLALAKRIKERYPDKFIVFGGANCEGEMGIQLHRLYSQIDAVVGGEADVTFPALVERYLDGDEIGSLPGVTIRQGEESIVAREASMPIGELDELPFVDYDDFFADRARAPNVSECYDAVPLFESARGCWWGQKHHCTFCGLNALGMTYRSKSQERAYAELSNIAERYGREILVVDNILDFRYFEKYLPLLTEKTPPLLMHYEVKANLRASQLSLLARAGIRKIQPGIESFSTNILRIMRKGTTMLRNVQTLKLAAEAGVYVEWGHLYGFPGETVADYQDVLDLLPFLTHLSPPCGVTRVRADRFSPYFDNPASFGVTINPLPAYFYIYPSDQTSIEQLAYHFDISIPGEEAFHSVYAELRTALETWNARAPSARLSIWPTPDGGAQVYDCRVGSSIPELRLGRPEMRALTIASEICGLQQLRDELVAEFGFSTASDTIDYLTNHRLLLIEEREVLALPLRQPGFERAPLKSEIRHSLERSFLAHEMLDRREIEVSP